MRDLDSLVDQALQEMWDKAVAEDAVPWNDAEPSVPYRPMEQSAD